MTNNENHSHKVGTYKRLYPQMPKVHIRRLLAACFLANVDPEVIFRRYRDNDLSATPPEHFYIAFKLLLQEDYSR